MHAVTVLLPDWLSRLDVASDVMWRLQNLEMTEFITIGAVLVLVLAFTVRRAVGAR